MESNRLIKLNEKQVTQEEFEQKKEEIEQMPNAELVEVKKDEYKIRMRD